MNITQSDLSRKKQSLDHTLARQETALAVDKELSVEGKTLKEILEADGGARSN